MRIRILREGKPKDTRLRALQDDYLARIGHFVEIRVEESAALGLASGGRKKRPAAARRNPAEGLEQSYKILLDPGGREWTSKEFADWLGERALRGTRELAFLVGGHAGFAPEIREKADLMLGLSRMTLTHDWACTLLLEQIYRAFTILRGHPYPR